VRIGLVVPHIFMQAPILPRVIFSPGQLALELADGLQKMGEQVTIFTPGAVETSARNITADLGNFEKELAGRGDDYLDLLRKHPLTFISLARQAQSELLASAFAAANRGELDIVHIYTNEEDIALPFAQFCQRPVVFTHHDHFNFQVKYKNVFPKYKHLNWISISRSQRAGMPADTNWVGNIYHGLAEAAFAPDYQPEGRTLLYLGRIIEPKGVHLAIQAVQQFNASVPTDQRYKLVIAGKHYASDAKDSYWQKKVLPLIDDRDIRYVGFVKDHAAKQKLLRGARALLVPSTFAEPFGVVAIEALACGTPVIGLAAGALPEIITSPRVGLLAPIRTKNNQRQRVIDEPRTITGLAALLRQIDTLDPTTCRQEFATRFTLERMCREHLAVYRTLVTKHMSVGNDASSA